MVDSSGCGWLVLIHQLPPQPNYFRVKIGRRLQRLGAVAIKNSVYVLPNGEQAHEDFAWLLQEIVKGGGEASVCEARFVAGLSDDDVQALFHAARAADYAQLAEEARAVLAVLPDGAPEEARAERQADAARLRKRLAEVGAIDFFGAPGQAAAAGLLGELEARLASPGGPAPAAAGRYRVEELRGRTWVTRQGIQVDRIASAWLIRRFVDPQARFKFVPAKGYRPAEGELRFDMFEAEFTHEGDDCTFETLIARLGLEDRALRAVAEIVHDIDIKDGKFGRPEAAGVASLLAGVALAHRDDEARLARGGALCDDLYEYFRKKR